MPISDHLLQLVAQGVPILQGGEELGGPVSYLRSQIHLLMSIARVRPFDMVGHFPSFWRGIDNSLTDSYKQIQGHGIGGTWEPVRVLGDWMTSEPLLPYLGCQHANMCHNVVSMKSQPPLRLATFCVEASHALSGRGSWLLVFVEPALVNRPL